MKFNHKLIVRITSMILLFQGVAMILPLFAATYYNELSSATAFFTMSLLSISFGTIIYRFYPAPHYKLHHREGYYIVFLSWLIVVLWGALPYYFTGANYKFYDCIFESCAGWTTTGSTVWDYKIMPKSVVLWKTITSWMGGMGIILLATSLFTRLGVGGQKIASAEIPGPGIEKLTARFGDTGKISYIIYIILTILEFLLLLPTKMGLYDACVNTLSTISTSGMIFTNGSSGEIVLTPYIKTIITIFTIAASINFISYYLFFHKKFREAINFYEIKIYLTILAISCFIMGISIYFTGKNVDFFGAIGNAIVQGTSFAGTSGYVIGDIGNWPTITKFILIILSLIGGCSFSTAGGMKVIRFAVMMKLIKRGTYKRIHPRWIKPVMIQNKPVSTKLASSITVFLLLYFGFFMFSALIISINDFDMETTLSATIASFTNTGVSFGLITAGDFSFFAPLTKLYLCVLMLAGRLEMFAIIILFSRYYWNSDSTRN